MDELDRPRRVVLFRDHPAERWLSMDRYAENLMQGLQELASDGWQFRMPMPPRPRGGVYGRIVGRTLGYPWWARWQRGSLNHVLDHSYAHLLHGLDPERTLVTVHDAAPWRYPGRRLGASTLAWRAAWSGLRRARRFIVVSDFVAAELGSYLDLPREQCDVVPLGVSEEFRPEPAENRLRVRRRFAADEDFLLLHVGRGHARKNLPTLLEALAKLRERGVRPVLVQVGARSSTAVTRCIERLGLEGTVHRLGHVPTRFLAGLYAAADVFVFPSLYEGFGLPVLEAMACGTPVVAARAASLPEVVGDAGLLVDPHDAHGMAGAVERVLSDEALRRTLRKRGLARARQRSWRRTAEGTLEVYRACA